MEPRALLRLFVLYVLVAQTIAGAQPVPAVTVDPTSISVTTPSGQNWGWEFTVGDQAIKVTHLGLFDYNPVLDPLVASPIVTLWCETDGLFQHSAAISSQDELNDGYRFQEIDPVLLDPNETYIVSVFLASADPLEEMMWFASAYSVDSALTDANTACYNYVDSSSIPLAGKTDGYQYFNANFMFEIASTVVTVEIDIKPGSSPNTINLGSNGVIPVAILSSADFNALDVDTTTVQLQGKAGVRVKGNGAPLAVERDVNGDGHIDLELKIEVENLEPGDIQDGIGELTGTTTGGQDFIGTDAVTIVPPE